MYVLVESGATRKKCQGRLHYYNIYRQVYRREGILWHRRNFEKKEGYNTLNLPQLVVPLLVDILRRRHRMCSLWSYIPTRL